MQPPAPERRTHADLPYWILLFGALVLVAAGMFAQIPEWAGLVLFACATAMALISLKMKRKVFPIIGALASAIPLFCFGGISLFGFASDIFSGERQLFETRPAVQWDAASGAVIVEAARPIRHHQVTLTEDYTRNYIPEARLWGDGRIIWCVYDGSGARTVMQGSLTQAQVQVLLEDFVSANFFGWKSQYTSLMPYDNPSSDYLTVNLLSTQKTVSVTMTEGPEDFARLFDLMSGGAGAPGAVFEPTEATLIAVQVSGEARHDWDQENVSVDLAQAGDGAAVSGETLRLAWSVVNENPYFPPMVSQNGQTYMLYLLVPGLMY